MNQQQRKFLIDKIESQVKVKIEALKSSIPNLPDLNKMLYAEAMLGTFEIRSADHIKAVLKAAAMEAKEGDNWLTGDRRSWESENSRSIKFKLSDIIVVPKQYQDQIDECKVKREEANKAIFNLQKEADMLITRIQLASDKVLDTMINEVDDMGNLSLMDTKIKLLNA